MSALPLKTPPPEVSLREAHPTDAAAIAGLHVESWRDAYASILDPAYLAEPIENDRLALWIARLEQPPPKQIVHVAERQNGQVVGFICAYSDFDQTWGSWIDNVHVLPLMRGRRIGELLLSSIAELLARRSFALSMYLWVFEQNLAALRFYDRMGGKIVGSDQSRIPAAMSRTIVRVHWPDASVVAENLKELRNTP